AQLPVLSRKADLHLAERVALIAGRFLGYLKSDLVKGWYQACVDLLVQAVEVRQELRRHQRVADRRTHHRCFVDDGCAGINSAEQRLAVLTQGAEGEGSHWQRRERLVGPGQRGGVDPQSCACSARLVQGRNSE